MASSPLTNSPPQVENDTPTDSAPSRAPSSGTDLRAPSAPIAARCDELNAIAYPLLGFFLITFTVWLVFAWSGYKGQYAQSLDAWTRGTTRTVEITVIREDAKNLACASNMTIRGLRCGYRANQQPFDAASTDDQLLLRPYNTVDSVLLVGAGLWSSPKLQRRLPTQRFSVVCEFHMLEAVRSMSIRFAPNGKFEPLQRSVPLGTLSNCEIPR